MSIKYAENRLAQVEAGRARLAFEKVKNEVKGKSWEKEYKAHTRKLAMLIKVNGLAAAVTFARAKSMKDKAWKALCEHIEERLKDVNLCPQEKELVDYLTGLEIPSYRLAENEVLSFINWLKRFAEGLIEGEADEQG
ncbi:MAG: type III-B CRISPR module-associated protein Cmr5 [Armatimonadetes bacterium]|nr:type III-B CRISPR module-associated protein Cmr5 [Armatimonadota bacterium]